MKETGSAGLTEDGVLSNFSLVSEGAAKTIGLSTFVTGVDSTAEPHPGGFEEAFKGATEGKGIGLSR
ncbi:hypothetical protein D3C71_1543060 [compost metagenome]